MSARSPSTSKTNVESLRLQMERSIDHLADLARSSIEPGAFFAEVLTQALHPGGASRAILWRESFEGTWEPAGERPSDQKLSTDAISERQELLADVSADDQPRFVNHSEVESSSESNGSPAKDSRVFSPIRHAGQAVGILETSHALDSSGRLPPDTFQFFAALCEITADFLSQHELQQLRRTKTIWQQWDQFSNRLWQTLELPSVCAAIANDGRLVTGCDRISVLIRRGRSYRLKSVTGLERVEPRSSATRSIESLAKWVVREGRSIWHAADDTKNTEQSNARLTELLQRHVRDSGATHVGVVPLPVKREANDRSPPFAVFVFESFQPVKEPEAWRSSAELLANRSTLTLRMAIERSNIPWLGLWHQIQRLPEFLIRPSTLFVQLLIAAIVYALVFVKTEFTVTGPAELWPDHRRDVFASTSGIVDEILVKHGDDVKQDQPLLVLRDPELESETPRITGEIATVNERLKAVQAARLTGGNTPDAVAKARQLTADEEELKERLRTLELQRQLIEERRQALTLRSPITGKVLTWDVTQHLSARPVERGQSLLTIGDTSGSWVVEIRVPDKDAGPMLAARKSLRPDLDVEFMLTSEPGRTYQGKVREVSLSSESDDAMNSHLKVVVAFDRNQVEQPRPGATAVPRIRCGEQSLGYVWLHDLIDAVRMRLLF